MGTPFQHAFIIIMDQLTLGSVQFESLIENVVLREAFTVNTKTQLSNYCKFNH